MPSKKYKSKHRPKHAQRLAGPDLLKQAEEQLQRGQTELALQSLRLAENDLKPRTTPDGKRITMPPHLIAAQAELPGVMARAQAAHSLTLTDPRQKMAALEDAIKRAPAETRYLVALGACRLSQGEAQAAFADFQKADELSPGDKLATRAFALGLLANGRAREASQLLKQSFAEPRDENQRRLAAISDWLSGDGMKADSTVSQSLLLGLSHLSKNETDQARMALATWPAIDRNLTRNEAALLATQFFYSGAVGFAANRFHEAMNDWREARRLTKSHNLSLNWSERLTAYYHRLAERAWAEDLPLAIECWREALAIAPADNTAAHNLMIARRAQAQADWRDGRIEQAAGIWLELLQTKPADETLLQSAALACERLNRNAEALNHWRALAKIWRPQFKLRADESGFKDKLEKLQERILDLMHKSGATPEQQLHELELALRLDPDDKTLLHRSAEVLLEMGKPHRSLKYLDQIERLHGTSANLLAHKAVAIEMSGNTKAAQKAFQQAVEMEPDNQLTRMAYLRFLGREAVEALDKENLNRAIELCQEQLRIDPKYHSALSLLASIYFEVDRKPEAKVLMNRIIEANPDKPQSYVSAGGLYWKFNLKKEAKAAFAKAIELDSSAECHFEIGLAYLLSCEHKEAVKCFDRAATTASFDLVLEMAMELFEHGEKKDAQRFIDRAKKLDPTHPAPYFVNAIRLIGSNPLQLLMASDKERKAVLDELDETERLIEGRKEYDSMRESIGQIRRLIEESPLAGLGGLTSLLFGGKKPDFFFDDDEGGFFPPAPRRGKKKR